MAGTAKNYILKKPENSCSLLMKDNNTIQKAGMAKTI